MKITTGAVINEPGSSVKNKTGGWRTLRPVKDPKKCNNCGFCWLYCPENAIDTNFDINYDYCKGCGICAKECLFNAITMEKEKK
ncbi:4Fe-4S binding protein [Candidatus Woesearchaeota archaeon]|jgi:2-oxoacid:acceptor oxidoreductase delta subunit (pyruvate/2-ketoisovalerate family)|nr:4Fe-4S binding protein [Candidatus Woesearchaeota archaeon]